jgi:hypothetical protein
MNYQAEGSVKNEPIIYSSKDNHYISGSLYLIIKINYARILC